jgi:DNA-binding response OmpR family regulator
MPVKILVVDDEADTISLLTVTLNQAGYEVVTANCGQACLQMVPEEHPDLILLDMMMPDMSGLDVLKTLQETYGTYNTPPVIFFTAKNRMEDRIEGLEAGAFKYLIKPTPRALLLNTIRAALAEPKK